MSTQVQAKKSEETAAKAKIGLVAEKAVLGIAETAQCPQAIKPYLIKAAPFIGKTAQAIEDSIPFVQKVIAIVLEYYEKAKPYRPDLLLPSLVGFIMCFFGGCFLTTIAAYEAFLMCGYDSTKKCVLMLIEDFQKVIDANKKDDAKDEDGDGVPDTQQITNQDLIKRKAFLFLTTMEPDRLNFAIAGINAGFLAIIATLKLEFAKTITLGNSIGASLEEPAKKYALPVVEKLLPPEYKKWGWPMIQYAIRTVAISIAWTLQRVVSAFHSSIRGGLLFSRNLMHYLTEMNIYKIDDKDSYLDEVVGYGLAVLGFYFQLRYGFALPFPLNVILFPFSVIEYLLIWAVTGK